MDDTTDLAAWVRQRDDAAFARVVQRHAALVTGICRRRIGDGSADEAAQAVFIILARRAGSISDASNLGAWLHGVAVRVCRETKRAAIRRAHHERHAASIPRPEVDPMTAWNDLRPHLDEAIATLSSPQRAAVVGHFLEGLTQSAVAERLGISEDAAHKRIHYALDKLRQWFAGRGIVVGAGVIAAGLASEASAAEPALVTACTQAALHPAAAPGASAIAGSVLAVGTAKLAVLAALGALLVGAGSLLAWHALAPIPPPAPPQTIIPAAPAPPTIATAPAPRLVFAETFDDNRFGDRGWYDNPQGFTLSSAEHAHSGDHAAEFHFRRNAETPISGGQCRRLFPPVTDLRLSYWVTYGPEWIGSATGTDLLQVLVLTTEDEKWVNPSSSHLTCVIGAYQKAPFVSLRDRLNIDIGRIGEDLTAITENRSVCGGNGGHDDVGPGECYRLDDGSYWNQKRRLLTELPLTDQPGPAFKGRWQHVELHLRLNRIVDGKGTPDGILTYRVDGQALVDLGHVLFRTGRFPDMRFNQVVIAPWTTRGSPIEQTFWIDDLTVSTSDDTSSR